jgi:hypothetical protein
LLPVTGVPESRTRRGRGSTAWRSFSDSLGFVVGVEATDLVPGELGPLLYRIFGLGVIADFLVAFGHRPRCVDGRLAISVASTQRKKVQIGDIRCVHATEEGIVRGPRGYPSTRASHTQREATIG